MGLAVPVTDGRLSPHFGHCECFALVDVDPHSRTILSQEEVAAPPHQPGLLPRWLVEKEAQIVITGGVGQRAQGLFAAHGITVITGAPAEAPDRLVAAYLSGTLQAGENVCDH